MLQPGVRRDRGGSVEHLAALHLRRVVAVWLLAFALVDGLLKHWSSALRRLAALGPQAAELGLLRG